MAQVLKVKADGTAEDPAEVARRLRGTTVGPAPLESSVADSRNLALEFEAAAHTSGGEASPIPPHLKPTPAKPVSEGQSNINQQILDSLN